jgi:hypothetical protein
MPASRKGIAAGRDGKPAANYGKDCRAAPDSGKVWGVCAPYSLEMQKACHEVKQAS